MISLLTIMSFTFLNMSLVWAEPFTIHINADGSIDRPTANITTVDNFTYTFTDNNRGGILVERDNIILDGAGYVLRGFQNNSWHQVDPNDTVVGVDLAGRNNVTVQNLIITYVPYGIELNDAVNCIVRENIINSGSSGWPYDIGVSLGGSDNTVVENTFDSWVGVDLWGARNIILRNQFYAGIAIQVGWQHGGWSSDNVIAENNFADDAVIIVSSSMDTFYHNNFYPCNVMPDSWSQTSWNETYPTGGNYWSNYNGVDVYSGPYQNETGSDGIGDTPYVIAENQTDSYPLMGPWTMTGENVMTGLNIISAYTTGSSVTFERVTSGGITTFNAQTGPDAPKGSRPLGYPCNISTRAEYSGNVEVTLTYDPTNITQTEEKVLRIMQWTETTLTWTNITAKVDTQLKKITGQTTSLSVFAVMWRLGGDVNGDFTVNLLDAILLSMSYNTTPQNPSWNPNADMNNDNTINILDAIILSANYQRTA